MTLTTDVLYELASGEKHGRRRSGDDSLCPVAALSFDADGGLHTVVRIADAEKRDVLIHDGLRHDPQPRIESVFLSDDGRHIAYAAKSAKKWRAVIDGEAGPEFDEIVSFEHGPDGRVAYVGRTKKKWYCVIDGELGDAFAKVEPPTWSPAEGGFRYAANRGGKFDRYGLGGGGEWVFFVDRDPTEGPGPKPPPRRHVERVDGGVRMVVDGQPGEVFESVGYDAESDDGAHWAYLGTRDGVRTLIVDGAVRDEFEADFESSLVFSPDGSRLAYYGGRDGKQFVNLDGEIIEPPYDHISGLRFSPDSRRIAYVALEGTDKRWVVDGEPGPLFDELTYDMLDTPFTWSADSEHFAYVGARKKKHVVVVDHQPVGDPFLELITWKRHPEGDRVIGIARTKAGFCAVTVQLVG